MKCTGTVAVSCRRSWLSVNQRFRILTFLLCIVCILPFYNFILLLLSDQNAEASRYTTLHDPKTVEIWEAVTRGSTSALPVKTKLPSDGYLGHVRSLVEQTGRALPCSVTGSWTGDFNISLHVAINLHNSEDILPNMVQQLWMLSEKVPKDALFVVVYESGSTDGTHEWLRVLSEVMRLRGVAHDIVTGGNITRGPEQRIEFLAAVRNAALQNALQLGRRLGTDAHTGYLVYINDVYFCHQDILNLVNHGADVACAMDFKRSLNSLTHERRRGFMVEDLSRRFRVPVLIAKVFARSFTMFRIWRRWLHGAASIHGSLPLLFYDIWVARDITGRKFIRGYPYVVHEPSAQQLAQGLPIPVYSCWNGLVAFKAEPFYDGLRFRWAGAAECPASECSLLLADLHARGYHNVLVDPLVRVAYSFQDAQDLHSPFVEGLSDGWQSRGSAAADRGPTQALESTHEVECCPLAPLSDQVDYRTCYMMAA